jgi:hypothetical protein
MLSPTHATRDSPSDVVLGAVRLHAKKAAAAIMTTSVMTAAIFVPFEVVFAFPHS